MCGWEHRAFGWNCRGRRCETVGAEAPHSQKAARKIGFRGSVETAMIRKRAILAATKDERGRFRADWPEKLKISKNNFLNSELSIRIARSPLKPRGPCPNRSATTNSNGSFPELRVASCHSRARGNPALAKAGLDSRFRWHDRPRRSPDLGPLQVKRERMS
jgi:hypothetical protein